MSALLTFGAACLAAAAAFAQGGQEARRTDTGSDRDTARAALVNSQGATIGDALLLETPNGVLLQVDLRTITPGVHALHVHAVGQCDRPDFKSAGGHWAPARHHHGMLSANGPHAGDLPNVHVFAENKATLELFLKEAQIAAGPHPILDADGAALVLHEGRDDYRTDPAGESGDRIACGVIAR